MISYTHRNGETEPPTEAGWYQFLSVGEAIERYLCVLVTSAWARRGMAMVIWDAEPWRMTNDARIADGGGRVLYGRWWGPITRSQPDYQVRQRQEGV